MNSAFVAAYTAGLIEIYIPAERMVILGGPLTTGALAIAIPELAKVYGNNKLVDI
jgi:hypothetical protein